MWFIYIDHSAFAWMYLVISIRVLDERQGQVFKNDANRKCRNDYMDTHVSTRL